MDLGAHLVSHYFTGCGSCVCSQNHSILHPHTPSGKCVTLIVVQLYTLLYTRTRHLNLSGPTGAKQAPAVL